MKKKPERLVNTKHSQELKLYFLKRQNINLNKEIYFSNLRKERLVLVYMKKKLKDLKNLKRKI